MKHDSRGPEEQHETRNADGQRADTGTPWREHDEGRSIQRQQEPENRPREDQEETRTTDGQQAAAGDRQQARGDRPHEPDQGQDGMVSGPRDIEDDSGQIVQQNTEEPDVYLHVPVLKVDEISLEVDDLDAHVSVNAMVLKLVQLNVGADAHLGRLNLTIKGVDAKALLKVRLEKVYAILARTLTTLDRNPQILEKLLAPIGGAVGEIGKGLHQTLPQVGAGVEKTLPQVGHGVEQTLPQVGHGVEQTLPQVGAGVEKVGGGVGDAAQQLGGGVGGAVSRGSLKQRLRHPIRGARRTASGMMQKLRRILPGGKPNGGQQPAQQPQAGQPREPQGGSAARAAAKKATEQADG